MLGLILPLWLPPGGLTGARTRELGSQGGKGVEGEAGDSFWPWLRSSVPRTGLDSDVRPLDLNSVYKRY